MESGRMTTQRWPSLSSLAALTAAAMAEPELPPVLEKSKQEFVKEAEPGSFTYSNKNILETHRTAGPRL